MKIKLAVILACSALSTAALADQGGDALSDALHAPGHVSSRRPDETLPIYLKTGSLVCPTWQRLRSIADEAARAPDSEEARIIKSGDCARAPSEAQVSIVRTDPKSWDGTAERTYGFAKIKWHSRLGDETGYVGNDALRN